MADETSADDGHGGDTAPQGDTSGAEDQRRPGASPFVFMLGLLAFVGSVVAFVADIVTGHDVLRSLLVNAASAVVLVWWAGADTLSDPDSSVTTRRGAAGTGLLLLGLYLLVGAVVVGVTSLVHDRFGIVPWVAGLGVVATVVGFLVFPRGSVLDADEDANAGAAASGEEGEGKSESENEEVADAPDDEERGEDDTRERGG